VEKNTNGLLVFLQSVVNVNELPIKYN